MNMHPSKGTEGNRSAERLIDIIEFMAEYGKPVRLKTISAEMDINSSTVLRFLITLMKKGYVIQDPENAMYHLSMKICSLSEKVRLNNKTGDAVQPFLTELANELGEAVFFMEEYGYMSVCTANAIGKSNVVFPGGYIGSVSPLHCTSSGKVFLSHYTEEQLDAYIRAKGLAQFTDNTIITRSELLSELNSVRTQGYAFDNEEMTLGIRSMSFPIYDYSSHIAGTLTVMGLSNSLSNHFVAENTAKILKLSENISEFLGSFNKK